VWRLWLTAKAVTIGADRAIAVGRQDVDTDIFFAGAHGLPLDTETRTHHSWGITDGKYGRAVATQTGLFAPITVAAGLTAVIYPRLKGDPAAQVVARDGGKVIEIRGKTATDFVMLSGEPFTFRAPEFTFTGTVGLVRLRNGRSEAALGARGEISTQQRTLKLP